MPYADAIEAFPEPEFLEGAPPSFVERALALLAHAGGIFTSFVVPAVLMMTQRGKSAFVVRHAREALNHQVTLLMGVFLITGAGVLGAVYAAGAEWKWSPFAAGLIILAVSLLMLLLQVYLAVGACQAAMKGRDYRYPLTIRLIQR